MRLSYSGAAAVAAWSPTLEGFRTMFRRPSFSLAEIPWRWSFGGAAFVLATAGLLEYLSTLPVARADLIFLRTGNPILLGHALTHIARGSASRLVLASVVLFSGLAVLWILLSSLGRAAVLAPIFHDLRRRICRITGEPLSEGNHPAWRLRSFFGLNFLRAALAVAAFLSAIGIAFLAGAAFPEESQSGLRFVVLVFLLLLIGFVWWSLNWFVSLASVFVVREGQDTVGALWRAVQLCRERLGAIIAVGAWFGLVHWTLFMIATSVVGFPLSLAALVPPGIVLAAVLLVTLAYFALADALYIGRLAGYVAILETPPAAVVPPIRALDVGPRPSWVSPDPTRGMVDQDEWILGDQASPGRGEPTSNDRNELTPGR
jgi:hypothetical protein